MRFVDAMKLALRDEMRRDPEVFVLGEDVTVGGPFGATAQLVDEFGTDRVVNTPISEDTIMGLAVGAALVGRRPILEIMFIDFMTLAMNQLVAHAAKMRYMSGGQLSVPMVIRVQGGALGGWGSHHSQSLESWFTHVPGLKVVAASNPSDARILLSGAIRDPDPVIVLEHRALYFRAGEVNVDQPIEDGPVSARVAREGSDVTIVSYSRMVLEALEAAAELAGRGVSAEVIDLRSLSPLDLNTVYDSVSRTHRAVIAHEAVMTGGIGAEIAARIQEDIFDELDAPVARVGAPFAPVPAGPSLEEAFVPGTAEIVSAVERTLGINGR
jgi:acetoin:2,6-dichlorophenolindophenol oxidoreductase subunit beta